MLGTVLTKGPEKVFIVVKNDSAATINAGEVLEWISNGTRDGIAAQVMQTAAQVSLCAGVAKDDIAVGKYGLSQVYGVNDAVSAYKHGTATNSNVAIGDIGVACSLGRVNFIAAGAAASSQRVPFVAMETMASASASSIATKMKCFIRLM
jgi:hypothetical protein